MSNLKPTAERLKAFNPGFETILDTPECRAWGITLPKDGSYLIWIVYGKAVRCNVYDRYRDKETALKFVEKAYHWRLELAANKAADLAQKREFKTTLKVGDILTGSWGYDQTNVEAVQVVAVSDTGKTITVREIALQTMGETSWCSAQVVPVKDRFTAPETKKTVLQGNVIKWGHASLRKWEGSPMHQSWGA